MAFKYSDDEYSQEDSEDSEESEISSGFLASDSDSDYDDIDRPYEQSEEGSGEESDEGYAGVHDAGSGDDDDPLHDAGSGDDDPLHELDTDFNFNQRKGYGTLRGDSMRRRRQPSLRGGLRPEIPVPIPIYKMYRQDKEHRDFIIREFGDGIQHLSSSEGEE